MRNQRRFTKCVKECGFIAVAVICGWLAGCGSGQCWNISPNSESIHIRIPETETTVTLDQVTRIDGSVYLQGDYSIEHVPDVVERGTVSLNSSSFTYIRSLDIQIEDRTLFAAPFSVSNQGSGVFSYIGLFAFNPDTEAYTHLDSCLLGDRVQKIGLSDAGRAAKVRFLKHAVDQPMSERPDEPAAVNLYIQDNLTWRVYPGMHPSWDKDNDGINDCEDDGTCDDSVDYTIAREDRSP